MKTFFAHPESPSEGQIAAFPKGLMELPAMSPQSPTPSTQLQLSANIETMDRGQPVRNNTSPRQAAEILCARQSIPNSYKQLADLHETVLVEAQDNSLDAPSSFMINTKPPDCLTLKNFSAPPIIDMAFEEDTRLYGMHPANLNAEQSAKLESVMPIGYRYARAQQPDLVFIAPLNHPKIAPGDHFIVQKKGTCAIPIIKPPNPTKGAAVSPNEDEGGTCQVSNWNEPLRQNTIAANSSIKRAFS